MGYILGQGDVGVDAPWHNNDDIIDIIMFCGFCFCCIYIYIVDESNDVASGRTGETIYCLD